MPRASKKSVAKKPSAKKPAARTRKTAAKRPSRKRASSVTRQAKTTAMKVLAGAASGAVQALIPPLEEAAGRTAKSAGTDKKRPQTRK